MKIYMFLSFAITQFLFALACGAQTGTTVASPLSQIQLAVPQDPGKTASASASSQISEVFVSFNDYSAQDSKLMGIGTFAANMLRLRLNSSMSLVNVYTDMPVQSCSNADLQPKNDHQEMASAPKSREITRYYVSGNIEVVAGSTLGVPNVAFHYQVKKCTGKKEFLLIQPQDLNFSVAQAVDELNWVVNHIFHQIQSEAPRELVSVHGCRVAEDSQLDDELKPFADRLKTSITDKINSSGEFQVSTSDNEENIIDCTFIPKIHGFLAKTLLFREEVLEARISLKTSGQARPYEDPDFATIKWGDRKNELRINAFAEDTASKALGALRFVRGAERLGLGKQLETWEAENYLGQGKRLLEAESQTSEQDLQSALESLTRAKKLDGNNPVILRYLGQAQVGNRLYSDAKASLEEALAKLKPPQKKSTLEAEINVLLGDALMGLNIPADAADRYLKGLEMYQTLADTDNVRRAVSEKYARALIQNHQRNSAIVFLLQALSTFSQTQDLHHQALILIRQLTGEELTTAYDASAKYCMQPEPIQNECALLSVKKAGIASEVAHNLADTGLYAEKALQFQPSYAPIHAEALGYAIVATLDKNPVKANEYLNEAEKLPHQDFQPNLISWLRRLRSEYWLQMKDFEKAYLVAKNAGEDDPDNPLSALMKAGVEVQWAEALGTNVGTAQKRVRMLNEAKDILVRLVDKHLAGSYNLLASANHALERDADSRKTFLDLVSRTPEDDAALETVLMVCIEWMSDFDCALEAAHNAAKAGFRGKEPEIQLDMIEAAILKGEDTAAEEWLKNAKERTILTPDLQAVRDFYSVWLAFNRNDKNGAQSSFANWKNDLQQLRRKDKEDQLIDWSFTGAKTIWSNRHIPEADLYLKMIKSMEDPQADLPSFPVGS